MNAVQHYGTPLVDDPDRVGVVELLGIDETSFLRANAEHPTHYVTGIVDLERRVLIDMIEGNRAIDVSRWLSMKDKAFLATIRTVVCDLHEGYRSGLHPHLDHARQVANPFHVVAVANRCLDQVRRRVQNEELGHRGRKDDPLYKIRRLLLTGAERLTSRGVDRMALGLRLGDPHDEVLGAWLAKEYVRDIYLTDDPDDAALLLDRHRRLSRRRGWRDRLARQHAQALAHPDPRPPPDRSLERTDRGDEPSREEDQALRATVSRASRTTGCASSCTLAV